ncbi:MAG: gliding motility-associated C-terminal domain-containing protein [Saprospiraceae bacterium]|nr:gliding motility-associated C-terminal domain-containing protein [Candidatus Opimibacter iunctus]
MGGCDSTVITQVTLLPTDTTIVTIFSCNPADTSHTSLLFTNRFGCDSLVYTNILLSPTDTTNIFQSTCDPAQVGVTEQALTNIYGCDSLVVTTVSYLQSDTTLINVRTCFIADTGTTSTLLINSKGCDSLVVVMTAYAGSDTTYLSSTTCVPQDSGTAIYTLLNQFGCDSILAVHTILLPTDTTYLSATTCEPLDTGTTNLLLNNVFGCDSLIVLHTILDPANLCDIEANLTVTQPLCYGDAGLVNVTAAIGLSPFLVVWKNTGTILKDSAIINSSPGNLMISLSSPGTYYFEIKSANGLFLADTVSIDDIAPLIVTATTETDMFGYSISCAGDATGTTMAALDSPGTPPYAYAWSDNSGVPQLNGLTAGIYSVTVTDSHGCTSTSSVTLTEPLPMQYQITTEDILCFGQQNGDVIISNTIGGVQPWSTSLDSGPFQNILAYTDLSAGNHDLVIKDRNGCTFNEQFAINEPDDWSIDLGPDTLIAYGTAYPLAVTIHGQPTGTLRAVWSDGQCDDCLSRTIVPGAVSTYTVTVTDENGCTHTDDLHIAVFIDRDLYVPNIFSPNGDQINDYFTITSGTGLKEIEELTIFDRWGNLVYQQFHFQADDQTASWDGSMNGKILNPGVYVYKLKVIYIDDRQEMRYGDITLIR